MLLFIDDAVVLIELRESLDEKIGWPEDTFQLAAVDDLVMSFDLREPEHVQFL
jgi:hypothetical protein